jgi:hypothetical protein
MVCGPEKVNVREKELKSGRMEVNMRATGKMIKQMIKEDLFMLTEMFTKVTGTMIKLKEEVPMNIWMEQNMLETGKKIGKMAMVLRLGQIMLNMKETMSLERSTVSALLNGPMDQLILENSIITTFTEKEFTHGLTTENMKESGVET